MTPDIAVMTTDWPTIACLASENHDLRHRVAVLESHVEAIHAFWIGELTEAMGRTEACREMVSVGLEQLHEAHDRHHRDQRQLRLLRRGGR